MTTPNPKVRFEAVERKDGQWYVRLSLPGGRQPQFDGFSTKGKSPMFKTIALIGVSSTLALLPIAALAEQGDSSSWGTVGWGPVIPTQSLTPKDREWNFNNTPLYQAGDGAEWLREHGKGLFPFF
jgi:hypothetical protein